MKYILLLLFVGSYSVGYSAASELSAEILRLENEKLEERIKEGPKVPPTSEEVKRIAAAMVEVERKGNVGQLRADDPQLNYIKEYLGSVSSEKKFGILLALRINEFTFPIYQKALESISDPEMTSRVLEATKSLILSQVFVMRHVS